jgi:hypothetical protein
MALSFLHCSYAFLMLLSATSAALFCTVRILRKSQFQTLSLLSFRVQWSSSGHLPHTVLSALLQVMFARFAIFQFSLCVRPATKPAVVSQGCCVTQSLITNSEMQSLPLNGITESVGTCLKAVAAASRAGHQWRAAITCCPMGLYMSDAYKLLAACSLNQPWCKVP